MADSTAGTVLLLYNPSKQPSAGRRSQSFQGGPGPVSCTVISHPARRFSLELFRVPLAMLALLALVGSWEPAAVAASAARASTGTPGERPPSRLRLVRPLAPLVPGQPASLGIETVGEHGELLAAQHPVAVTLSGAAGLTAATLVNLPAGSSRIAVPLSAAKPGLWQIEARAHGLYSASTVVVCVAPAVLQRHQALRAVPARPTASPGAAAAKAPGATFPPPRPPRPT